LVTFDLNGGDLIINNQLYLELVGNSRYIFFDMDGGNVSCNTFTAINNGSSNGDNDILIELDQSSLFNTNNNAVIDLNGGDDLRIKLNNNSGNNAQFVVGGDFTLNKPTDLGNDVYFNVDDNQSLFQIGGDFTINFTGNTSDGIYFNLDKGDFKILGNTGITTNNNAEYVYFDLDGGNFSTNDFNIQINGINKTDLTITVDATSVFNINNNASINFNGGDDLSIYLNKNGNSSAKMYVDGNFHLIKNKNADDQRIFLYHSAKLTVNGNFEWINNAESGDYMELQLANSNDSAIFNGDFTMQINAIGNNNSNDLNIDLNGGHLQTNGNTTITNTNGDDLLILMSTNATWFTGGNITIYSNILDDGLFYVNGNNNSNSLFVYGNLNLNYINGSILRFRPYSNTHIEVQGDIALKANTDQKLHLDIRDNSTVKIGGDIKRQASPNKYGRLTMHINSKLIFDGNNLQTIPSSTGDGNDSFNFTNLEVNNSSNLNMEGITEISKTLILNSGVIQSTSNNYLIIKDNASVIQNNSTSFIDGPVHKKGNDAFVFPVGDGSISAPLAINAGGSNSDEFVVEYFDNPPAIQTVDNTLNNVSNVEEWQINQIAGNSGRKVTLYWNDNSRSGINAYSNDLVVARLNGNTWTSEGQSSINNTGNSGDVTSTTNVGGFNTKFTFGSISSLQNPLPIELLSFEAIANSNHVDLKWSTASETNNSHFIVERSSNGKSWKEVVKVNGAGNSSQLLEYFEVDQKPLKGISYYRLKQVDFNGAYTYSRIVPVYFIASTSGSEGIVVYPNPVYREQKNINIQLNEFEGKEVLVVLRDLNGKEFYSKLMITESNNQIIGIPIDNTLAKGVYLITATSENKLYSKKVIVK
jgi:hypothetical protein